MAVSKSERLGRPAFPVTEYRDFQQENIFALERDRKVKVDDGSDPFYLAKRESEYLKIRIEKDKEKMRESQKKKEPQLFNNSYSYDIDSEGIKKVIMGDRMKNDNLQ